MKVRSGLHCLGNTSSSRQAIGLHLSEVEGCPFPSRRKGVQSSIPLPWAAHGFVAQGWKIHVCVFLMCVSEGVVYNLAVDCSKMCCFGRMQDEFSFAIPFSRLYKRISVCLSLGPEREGGDQ